MIFNRIVGIITPLNVLSLKRFNNFFLFSDIKKKAEKYLCAAVAYHKLADVDPNKLYNSQSLLPQTDEAISDSNKIGNIQY